jgi:flagellar capping protein FliD
MGTTSSIFTGSSQFSTDFQNVITRAVQIASLPMTQMNTQKSDLSNQASALSGLDSAFKSLQSSVSAIQSSMGASALQATVSDTTQATATLGDGAMEGVYSLRILDPGTYATSTTQTIDYSGNHDFKLSLNGVAYGLNVTDNSAAGLAAAINNAYGDQVQATVVNVGSSGTPDYRISVRSLTLGDVDPEVLDGTTSLVDPASKITGVPVSYVVNNSSVTSTSDSRTLSIAQGVTLAVKPGATGTVEITVAPSASNLSGALATFVATYNKASDAVAAQRGQAGGALTGDSIVNHLSEVLSNLATYSAPSGSAAGLASLGIDLGSDGHMTFNQFTLAALNSSDSNSVASFLGTASSGGFLQSASTALSMVMQSGSGLLPAAETSVQSGITTLTNQISDQQDRVDQLQTQLQQQMSAADALIASMEQQYSYIANMFSAMQTAAQQYK